MEVKNLKAYLANVGMKTKDFAELIDCDPVYLCHVMRGNCTVSRRFARDVSLATDGVITLKTRQRKRHLKKENAQPEQQQSVAM
jgi:hypothetical protein